MSPPRVRAKGKRQGMQQSRLCTCSGVAAPTWHALAQHEKLGEDQVGAPAQPVHKELRAGGGSTNEMCRSRELEP